MKALDALNKKRIFAIDPASHSYAFSVVDVDGNKSSLVAYGKVDLNKLGSNTTSRLKIINDTLPRILETYQDITHAVIEQSVYVQNVKTVRTLSYIVGHLWGTIIQYVDHVEDINPLVWKTDIGYAKITAAERKQWKADLGKKEADKKISFERKERVRRILVEKIPGVDLDDDDVLDAVGIGYWKAVYDGT